MISDNRPTGLSLGGQGRRASDHASAISDPHANEEIIRVFLVSFLEKTTAVFGSFGVCVVEIGAEHQTPFFPVILVY